MKRTMTAIPVVVALAGVLFLGTSFRGERAGIVPRVHAENHGGCTNASFQGAYAYRRTGVNNELGGPVAEIGVTIANGDGTLGGNRSSNSRNGEIQDWTDVPGGGRYTVDSDCTGSIFDASGRHTQNFIVVDGGKGFFLISTVPGRIVTAEGKRLDLED